MARAKRAEAQQKIQSTLASVSGNTSAFDTFDRMAKKVDELEARADAQAELADLSQSSSLDKEFAKLESSGAGADMLLEDLKRKMIGDGSTEPAGQA